MKIRWSQHAYNSLTDVLDYSLETFGFLQQVAIEDIIMTSIDKLVVSKEISVIYWLEDDYINVSFIWDTRRSLHHIYNIFKD